MIKFPFPIHAAELSDFGQEMAQALEKDLAESTYRQARKSSHILAYVLNPANQVTSALLNKYLHFTEKAQKAIDDKVKFMGTVIAYVENVERTYQQHLVARTIATTHLQKRSGTLTDTDTNIIMVRRQGDKVSYLVKPHANGFYSDSYHLFSDGVMLPCSRWGNNDMASYCEKVGTVSADGFLFANAALEQEFKQSPTVDDYFNEKGAFSGLDKLHLFFGSSYGELHCAGVNFANQATLDKFTALFPEIAAYAQQFDNKSSIDFIKILNFHRKVSKAWGRTDYFLPKDYKDYWAWQIYTFRYALWYLLFDGGLFHRTHSHEDILALLAQARCLQTQLQHESQRWEICHHLLHNAQYGIEKHQELKQMGFAIHQSVFIDNKGIRYLLTDFNVEAYGEELEFTRILKGGKLSAAESSKQYIRWTDIKQGHCLHPAT